MPTIADDRASSIPVSGLPTPEEVRAAGEAMNVATTYLADGVLSIDGCGSLFLFDLVHSRFQRLPRGSDAWRAMRYGSWLPLQELVLDADGTFIVEPGSGSGPRVRSHTHGVGCGCTAVAPDRI